MIQDNQSTAIAVMVKTPGLSPLKTRLAYGIGDENAHRFYLLSLQAIQETLLNMNIKPYWAIGEKPALDHPLWSEFNSIYTGEGNLGLRQHHIYETLLKKHNKVLLIGADAPQISTTTLQQAINELDSHDFVVGPAYDGGYYLFGGRRSTKKASWAEVPWSTSSTLTELEKALPATLHRLASLHDVDELNDLQYLEAEMPGIQNKQQKQLLSWVKNFVA